MKIKRHYGFSLIELMVAMMIGLFLIFVVMSSYTGNKSSNIQRAALGELESNARIAMEFLRNGIEHAGYPSTYVHEIVNPFLTSANAKSYRCTDAGVVTYEAATYINNNDRYTKDHASRDRISVGYMPDNPNDGGVYWQDCAASYAIDTDTNSIRAEKCSADPVVGQGRLAIVYNSYFIQNNELKCSTSRNVTIPIANGIEAIQFKYGMRISGNTLYRSASDMDNNWSNVISVQIAMLVRSETEVKATAESKTYLLLDTEVTKNDRRLRKVFTTFIHLSNQDRISR